MIKERIKVSLCVLAICALYTLAGGMEYEDAANYNDQYQTLLMGK